MPSVHLTSLLKNILVLLFLTSFTAAQAQTPFSQDSAASYLYTISAEIGPRPMGSPNEHRAMEFAMNKFREFGLHEVYQLPMKQSNTEIVRTSSNTNSGVVVGILKGTSDRIIVIGAHIDSEGPEIPGANDDGSGSAVVIELARILAQRKNESTLVFALFGGEERGLQGSRYFVEHFPNINRVALMLQVDMANGSEILVPTIDVKTHSSPEWLVRASYEELAALGHSKLYVPTHFFTLMGAVPGGGVGSDHQPFLEKNIPAIDFTSDFRDPIHTPQDTYENFEPSGLARSGDLIYKLVERFDAGVPEEKAGNYYLAQIGKFLFFVPPWLLTIFIILSLIVTAFALLKARQRRVVYGPSERPIIPGLKLFFLMLIIQTFVWLSENVVALIKGVRYPWLASLDGYLALGLLAGCIGIWISVRIAPKLNLRKDAYSYYLRAIILLLIFLGICALASVKLAFYPATALFFLGLSMVAKRPAWKLTFWILSPHFMYRLFFSEGFDFIAHAGHASPELGVSIGALLHVFYILFFSLWSFPFLLGFAAIRFDAGTNFLWLRSFGNRWGLAGSFVAFLISAVFLSAQPTFSEDWKQLIWVEQALDLDSTKVTVTVKSPEYLTGARLRFGGTDTIVGKDLSVSFARLAPPPEPWMTTERTVETTTSDSSTTFHILLKVRTKHRPYTLKVIYSGDSHTFIDASSPLAYLLKDNSIVLSWYSFPDTSVLIPLTLTIAGLDSIHLTESLEATFVEEIEPVEVEKDMSAIIKRTRLSRHTTLR